MGDLQQKLVKMVDKMPAFPQSVSRVMELTSDINCSPRDLVQVIDHDPVMTVKILKLVNSAYFGLSRTINSINQGVVFVGINTIKNLALTIATMGMLPKQDRGGLNMTKFLLHSLGTATVARSLAQTVGVSSRDSTDFFVAGLLHDFGKVVLAQFMSSDYEKVLKLAKNDNLSLDDVERQEIGADHNRIGGMLGEKWQLPPDLVSSIRAHHLTDDPDGTEQPEPSDNALLLRDCVFAANQITKSMDFGNSGNPVIEPFYEPIMNRFGKDMDALKASLGRVNEEMEKTRAFIRL